MRMPVQDGRHAVTPEWLFQPAASEVRIDFARLTFHGSLYRRVVKDHDLLVGPQAGQRRFELQRLVDRFVDELLDDGLAPWSQRAAPESAGKALHPGEPHPLHLTGIAIEHAYAVIDKNLMNFALAARLEVVVA